MAMTAEGCVVRRAGGTRTFVPVTVAVLLLLTGAAAGGTPFASAMHRISARVASAARAQRPGRARSTHIDPASVIEAVDHRVAPDPSGIDALVVDDGAYHARFDERGFTMTPTGSARTFRWSLAGAGRGDATVALRMQRWRADANVATRAVSAGASERVTARDGSLEWDLVLTHPPVGVGAFVVDV